MRMLRDIKRARQAGFTLVEIMIGMLIGLIGIVVIMQVFAVSEGFKRTATSGTDAQVNGAIALYILEREIRNSGFGMNALIVAGCTNVNMWDATAGVTRNVRMVPFEIVNVAALGIPAADPSTDVLLIAYGNADSAVEGVQVSQQTNAASDLRVYGNISSFRTGDKVVAMQPGAGAGGTAQCSMHELTKVPGAGGNCGQGIPGGGNQALEHNVVSYPNSWNACGVAPATKNKAGGATDAGTGAVVAQLTFTGGARLFNLGGNPVAKIYAVRGGNLTSCDMFVADCTQVVNYQVVANDIVSLSAVYGQDFEGNPAPTTPTRTVGDWQVDRWTRNVRADFNQVARTIAVGIQITARSGLREKPRTGTACDATPNSNRPDLGQTADWYAGYTPVSGSLAGAQINLTTASADWQCYRYKMFQTTVPIRNMIWRP